MSFDRIWNNQSNVSVCFRLKLFDIFGSLAAQKRILTRIYGIAEILRLLEPSARETLNPTLSLSKLLHFNDLELEARVGIGHFSSPLHL
jgi:hypothetical protein